ncbi:MAG: hypothetical protein PUC47_11260 [Oscillospiraceae bacterium]|nr:hypothetical protein [Oscillospiraceae bacterium]
MERAYLTTERAHFMCPNMHFGILIELNAPAISALGGFDSKAAAFVGDGMFGMAKPTACSLTNLGRIESETIRRAAFYPPASPAAKVTVGALTVNDTMSICLSRNKAQQ